MIRCSAATTLLMRSIALESGVLIIFFSLFYCVLLKMAKNSKVQVFAAIAKLATINGQHIIIK